MEEFFQERYFNPLTDFGFKRLFFNELNKDLLIDFLNEIIKEQGQIVDIQYLPTENWADTGKDRKAIFDIFCKNEKEEYFIVEMQKAKEPYFRDRSLYYATFPIQKQLSKGTRSFELKAVYLVAVLDFILFDESEDDKNQVIEQVSLIRKRTKTVYTDKLNLFFVELPKFRKESEELSTNMDKWLFCLKNLSNLHKRPIELQGRIFEKLFNMAEIKKLTSEDMEAYKKSILEYQDVRDAVDYAREEGREEGLEEGREEGKVKERIEIAKRCLQKGMHIEDIATLTELTSEQIKALM